MIFAIVRQTTLEMKMIYKKNAPYFSKKALTWVKNTLQKKRVQAFLLIMLFAAGLNSYEYQREDFVVMRSLGNYRISSKVRDVAKRHNIDPLLITSVILSESSGYPFAVSYMNARGLMQLMPATAQLIAKSLRKDVYEELKQNPGLIYKTDINLDLAAIHLKDMYHYSSKSWNSALHIYNLSLSAFRKGRRNDSYVNGILNRFNSWKG